MTRRLVVGVAVLRDGLVLAARRADNGDWEFPGGKVEDGEDPTTTAVREIAEELGCTIEVTGWLPGVVAIGADLELRVATARLVAGEPTPNPGDHDALRWLRAAELGDVDWAAPDVPFVAGLTPGLTPGLTSGLSP